MLVKVFGAAVQGILATLVTIEVNCSKGIKFMLVGLPDASVKESHERIVSALQINGYKFPRQQIVINMSPADIRKEGTAYDLPLAIGILAASEGLKSNRLENYMIMGELSLDGSILPIKGVLPIAIKARELGFKGLVLPRKNAREAAVVNNLDVYGVDNISEVVDFFNEEIELEKTIIDTRAEFYNAQQIFEFDFADVKGQGNGGHHPRMRQGSHDVPGRPLDRHRAVYGGIQNHWAGCGGRQRGQRRDPASHQRYSRREVH